MALGKLASFWQARGLEFVIPEVGKQFPEGFDLYGELQSLIGDRMLLEFGCGYGRLCGAFHPDRYVGLDFNQNAIEKAKETFPEYRFEETNGDPRLPSTEALLAYTVLLHIPDDEISGYIEKLAAAAELIIVGEIMDCRWRDRQGEVPVFSRNPEEYILLFSRHGMRLKEYRKHAYKHYDTDHWNRNLDIRMTLLAFAR